MTAPEMNSAPDRKRCPRMALLTLLLCLGACPVSNAGDLRSFTTDGCSAFPDGTPVARTAWLNCCIRHDLSYWKGGTSDERVDADRALEKCVADIGEPEIARLMLAGVRAGGSPYFPTPYRWGYGWPYPRGYKSLTDEERAQVQRQLEALELLLRGVSREIAGSRGAAVPEPTRCPLPLDVSLFKERRDLCDHFRDEPPYDAERSKFLADAAHRHCTGTDKEPATLRMKYRSDASVMRVLATYEDKVESSK